MNIMLCMLIFIVGLVYAIFILAACALIRWICILSRLWYVWSIDSPMGDLLVVLLAGLCYATGIV